MLSHIKCAIDSLPIGTSLHNAFDYSALQVYALTSLPLRYLIYNPLYQSKVEVNSSATEFCIILSSNIRWSDNTLVSPTSYLNGIEVALKENAFLAKFLFRKVSTIRVQSNRLIFNLSRPNYAFLQTLTIPNITTYEDTSHALSPGLYYEQKGNYKHFYFKRNPYSLRVPLSEYLKIVVVKSPARNLNAYHREHVNITADTAITFEQIYEGMKSVDFYAADSGLFCSLHFGESLAKKQFRTLRKTIYQTVKAVRFSDLTFNTWIEVDSYEQVDVRKSQIAKVIKKPANTYKAASILNRHAPGSIELILAYDDFYPNRQICTMIANILRGSGIKVHLIKDDFYNPNVKYDLKLIFSRGYSNDTYIRYSSLILLKTLQHDREAQREYLKTLIDYEEDSSELRDEKIKDMQGIITDNCLIVPLFHIPSFFYSNVGPENPLLLAMGPTPPGHFCF